ncbi:DUF38 domain-containing protein [Caenorhabditis elegans]|uniref:DUF38 domain-containing protein n=1 Tax=Caenorhabditis elegans TaxID=6239 RepID=O62123_CAEEL|nr:DUF38 domain-containing protein [Caenorhabditis elegans]CAB05473.2 DUF38 domain-containing protein [Caenorhabditis elegans]|eukprot:NP_510413.2 F-box A protein [Caenorhabditis elegans]
MTSHSAWHNLPLQFRKGVIEILDYKTRCQLRKCSRKDKNLVDIVPIRSKWLSMSVYNRSITLQLERMKIEYFNFDPKENNILRTEYTEKAGEYPVKKEIDRIVHGDLDLVVMDILLLLAHENSFLDNLVLQYAEGINPERMQLLNQTLFSQIKTLDPKWKIRTSSFYISFVTTGEKILEYIGLLSFEHLNHIRIKNTNFNQEQLEQFVAMDQWKHAKSMFLEDLNDISVAQFSHFETFWTNVTRLEPVDAWNVIKSYIKRNSPRGAFFHVGTANPIEPSQISDLFDVEVKNEPIDTPWPSSQVLHTQKFCLPSEDHVLIVLILNNVLTGRICHLNHLAEDCNQLYNDYFEEYSQQ